MQKEGNIRKREKLRRKRRMLRQCAVSLSLTSCEAAGVALCSSLATAVRGCSPLLGPGFIKVEGVYLQSYPHVNLHVTLHASFCKSPSLFITQQTVLICTHCDYPIHQIVKDLPAVEHLSREPLTTIQYKYIQACIYMQQGCQQTIEIETKNN